MTKIMKEFKLPEKIYITFSKTDRGATIREWQVEPFHESNEYVSQEQHEKELAEKDREIHRLRETFSHYHKRKQDDPDQCDTCGLDLRDPIHKKFNQ